MKDLKFAHISDTHFCCEGSSDFVKEVNEKYNPLGKLHFVLDNMAKPDFILYTGDTVHDGEAEDYAKLKAVFDQYFPDVPIYATMGNHDIADNFRVGFLGKEATGKPYYDVFYHDDLRIITLDSAFHYGMKGWICKEQCDFLKETLATNFGRGTIVITHHPFKWVNDGNQLSTEYDLSEIIENSDIIGFINGHAQINCVSFFHGRIHITGESMCFGIEPRIKENRYIYTEKMAWNECKLEGKEISFTQHAVSPDYTILKDKSM